MTMINATIPSTIQALSPASTGFTEERRSRRELNGSRRLEDRVASCAQIKFLWSPQRIRQLLHEAMAIRVARLIQLLYLAREIEQLTHVFLGYSHIR